MSETTTEANRMDDLALFAGAKHVRDAMLRAAAKAVAVICAIALALTLPIATITGKPSAANATPLSDAQKELRALTDIVEQAADAYNAEQDKITAASNEISRLQDEIDAIEERLAPYRAQLEEITKWQYISGSGSFLEMLLSEDVSLVDVIEQTQYLDKLTEDKAATMAVISEGEEELYAAQQQQKGVIETAETAKAEMQAIMDANQPAIDELQSRIDGLREEQRDYLLGKGTAGGGAAYDIPDEGDVVDYVLSRVGCPYVWGASGPSSFDCSGLVMWAYKQARGISLPHNSEAMYAAAKQRVPVSQAQPGDVLYRSGHVGICTKAGGAEYVHAPHSGAYVRLNDSGYSRFTCALRF